MAKSINCGGKIITFDTPKVMGILNITPDSFFAGSRVGNNLLAKAEQMILQGATFLDVGGYSTRPGALQVSESEELNRVLLVVKTLVKHFPTIPISVDTFRSEIMKNCLDVGATIINDISGGDIDPRMWEVAKRYKAPFVVMHMRGTPQTMMENTNYEHLTCDVIKELSVKDEKAKSLGINDIIIDPGFGFSKTLSQNYELMQNLQQFEIFSRPILVGISRKSMIYKILNTSVEQALNGTTSLNTIALLKGADILRVHDVKEAQEAITIVKNCI